MPTYQYACTSAECGHRFERVQAFTDPAITNCPDCDERVRKVYGSVGVVFKGSGFYRNDSRDAKSHGSAAKSGDSGGGAKSDAAGSGDSAAKKDSPSSTSSSSATSTDKSDKGGSAAAKSAPAAAAS